MLGSHLIKTWSTNQAVIALSSGEAGYHGPGKAGSVNLRTEAITTELGKEFEGRIGRNTDSGASISTSNHIDSPYRSHPGVAAGQSQQEDIHDQQSGD